MKKNLKKENLKKVSGGFGPQVEVALLAMRYAIDKTAGKDVGWIVDRVRHLPLECRECFKTLVKLSTGDDVDVDPRPDKFIN